MDMLILFFPSSSRYFAVNISYLSHQISSNPVSLGRQTVALKSALETKPIKWIATLIILFLIIIFLVGSFMISLFLTSTKKLRSAFLQTFQIPWKTVKNVLALRKLTFVCSIYYASYSSLAHKNARIDRQQRYPIQCMLSFCLHCWAKIDWKRFIITSPYELLINAFPFSSSPPPPRLISATSARASASRKRVECSQLFFQLSFTFRHVARAFNFALYRMRMQMELCFLSDLAKLIFNGLNVVGVIFLSHHRSFAAKQRRANPFFSFGAFSSKCVCVCSLFSRSSFFLTELIASVSVFFSARPAPLSFHRKM